MKDLRDPAMYKQMAKTYNMASQLDDAIRNNLYERPTLVAMAHELECAVTNIRKSLETEGE